MNRYDKEERIIQTFQDLKRRRIKIFPLNFNNILLYRLIHNKLLWKTWTDASSKNALPPDFYNNKFKLMMDVMRIDDHTFVDENEPLGQQKTYLQKYLQNKGFTNFGKSFFLK